MARVNKPKISTQGGAAVGGGFFSAFEKLEIGGLPEGPAENPPEEPCDADAPPAKRGHGRVVLRRETAHRGGKCVVVVEGFDAALDDAFLEALLKRLRAACGCGGTVKGRTLELQGEQATRARALLTAEGFRVAGVG